VGALSNERTPLIRNSLHAAAGRSRSALHPWPDEERHPLVGEHLGRGRLPRLAAVILNFNKSLDGYQFVERINWIPALGVQYLIGVDGISVLMVMLTTLMGMLAIFSSWESINDKVREYYAMFLLQQVGMVGVFISLDFMLFYVFWELCWCRCTSSSASGAVPGSSMRRLSSSFTRWPAAC